MCLCGLWHTRISRLMHIDNFSTPLPLCHRCTVGSPGNLARPAVHICMSYKTQTPSHQYNCSASQLAIYSFPHEQSIAFVCVRMTRSTNRIRVPCLYVRIILPIPADVAINQPDKGSYPACTCPPYELQEINLISMLMNLKN
jgi:hypothetical protein